MNTDYSLFLSLSGNTFSALGLETLSHWLVHCVMVVELRFYYVGPPAGTYCCRAHGNEALTWDNAMCLTMFY